ncbi:hypothetical protein [Nocardia sp. NPDC003979]
MAGLSDDPIATGELDHLLIFDVDDEFDPADATDAGDEDAGPQAPLLEVAAVAAALTGTARVPTEIARASVLGFDSELARLVLAVPEYQDQLRRHWTEHGVAEPVRAAAAEDSELGQLCAQLIERCGTGSAQTASDPAETLRDNVIAGPWSVAPTLPRIRAAASSEPTAPVFRVRNDDWGLEYVQSVAEDGSALIEIRVLPEQAEPLHIVRVDFMDTTRLVVLRLIRGVLSGHARVPGTPAWAPDGAAIHRPLSAETVPDSWLPAVTAAVSGASTSERNLWRRVHRALDAAHPVARAIEAGMR